MTAVLAAGQEQAPRAGGGRIIVGVDDSPGGLAALRWAVEVARSTGAPLVAVRAWSLGLPRHGGLRRQGTGRGQVILSFRGTEPRKAAARITRAAFRAAIGGIPPGVDLTIETPEGNPGPVLTQLASAGRDVLIVGTSPGHLVKRAVHGSVSAYCSRHLPGQVSVIAAAPPGRPTQGSGEPPPARNQAGGPRREADQ
jgi:nucleotide-binding universal stress UspA family protein